MNKFERGGEKNLRETLFGPPMGTLYFHGGRFPGFYMLVGRSAPGVGVFLPIGQFQGGGRKKTRFFFVSSKERYKWEYRFMKSFEDISQPMMAYVLCEGEKNSSGKKTRWQYIERKIGIKPIVPDWDI